MSETDSKTDSKTDSDEGWTIVKKKIKPKTYELWDIISATLLFYNINSDKENCIQLDENELYKDYCISINWNKTGLYFNLLNSNTKEKIGHFSIHLKPDKNYGSQIHFTTEDRTLHIDIIFKAKGNIETNEYTYEWRYKTLPKGIDDIYCIFIKKVFNIIDDYFNDSCRPEPLRANEGTPGISRSRHRPISSDATPLTGTRLDFGPSPAAGAGGSTESKYYFKYLKYKSKYLKLRNDLK